MKNTKETILKKMTRTPSGCWEWIGCTDRYGYGVVRFEGKQLMLHRLSWIFKKGFIPDGLCVLHRCDNRKCFNPEHLFLGTNQENTKDRHQKGRDARGERQALAVLTEKKVKEIRVSKLSLKKIAALYGVAKSTILSVRQRKTWKHLEA